MIYQAPLTLALVLFCVGCGAGKKRQHPTIRIWVLPRYCSLWQGGDGCIIGRGVCPGYFRYFKGIHGSRLQWRNGKGQHSADQPDGIVYKYFVTEEDGETVLPLTGGDGMYALKSTRISQMISTVRC